MGLYSSPRGHVTGKQQLAELAGKRVRQMRGEDTSDPITRARNKARDGNPLPLVAMQWPSLVIKGGTREANIFEGDADDPDNPILRIDGWQRHALMASFNDAYGEIFFKGCTGAGKGFITSIIVNLLYDVHTSVCKISVTSETSRHALMTMFAEIATWRRRMEHPWPGTLLGSSLSDPENEKHYVQVLNPSPHGAGEAFSGQHASEGETIYVFDEASAVPEVHYTNCLKNATKIFALSNPRIVEGWFRDGYRPLQGEGTKEERRARENKTGECHGRLRGKRLCFTIGGAECTNVKKGLIKKPIAPIRGITIDGKTFNRGEVIPDEYFDEVKAVIPGQIDLNQYQSIIDTSKENWQVECFAHAEFPSEDPVRQAILPSWFNRHIEYYKSIGGMVPVTAFGLDVARSKSGDYTTLSAGGIKGIRGLHRWKSNDNVFHVKEILRIAEKVYGIDLREGLHPVCVEMGGGYGGGVSDRLRELECWVIEFMPSGGPLYSRGVLLNQRCEWYVKLGERLSPEGNWTAYPFAVPPDDQLIEDLVSPMKMPAMNSTAWKLEPKEDIQKRLGRSPDAGDSVVCLYRAIYEQHDELREQDRVTSGIVAGSSSDESELVEDDEERIGEDGLPLPPMAEEASDPFADWLDEDDFSHESSGDSRRESILDRLSGADDWIDF